jgi:cell division protein FtsW (lipid II flippase)
MTGAGPPWSKVLPGAAVLTATVAVVTALSTAPWWMSACVFALAAVLGTVHLVFPQRSEHRLAWWQARWQRRRGAGMPPAPRRRR